MAERLTRRDKFVLEPYAQIFAGWNRQLETMPDFELWALRRAVKKPGVTNCWWATFDAAKWLKPMVESECERRKRVKARDRRAGRQALRTSDGGKDA